MISPRRRFRFLGILEGSLYHLNRGVHAESVLLKEITQRGAVSRQSLYSFGFVRVGKRCMARTRRHFSQVKHTVK